MRDIPWQRVIEQANRDGEFRIAARFWSTTLRLDVGERSLQLTIADGELRAATPCERKTRSDIAVCGPAEAWEELLAAVPRPLHQDLFGGVSQGRFQLEGDLDL